jgi:hypothetical protein
MMEKATPKVSRALKSLFNSGRYPKSASRVLSRIEPVPSIPTRASIPEVDGSEVAWRFMDEVEVDSMGWFELKSFILLVIGRFCSVGPDEDCGR